MLRTDTKFIACWLVLVVCQIIICDCMFLGPLVTVTLLPVLVMFIPLSTGASASMLIAFAAGFAVDWLSDGVLGLNMASLVPVALLRKPLVRLFIGEDTVTRADALNVGKSGWPRMLSLTGSATALFLTIYVIIDGAGERTFGFNMLRLVCSFAASTVPAIPVIYAFSAKNIRS